jgi:hypothetical protein
VSELVLAIAGNRYDHNEHGDIHCLNREVNMVFDADDMEEGNLVTSDFNKNEISVPYRKL